MLKAAMACLVGRVALWQISPRRASAQDEWDAIEYFPPIAPGSAAAVLAALRLGNEWVRHRPLGVGEVSGHASVD